MLLSLTPRTGCPHFVWTPYVAFFDSVALVLTGCLQEKELGNRRAAAAAATNGGGGAGAGQGETAHRQTDRCERRERKSMREEMLDIEREEEKRREEDKRRPEKRREKSQVNRSNRDR
jgi:hypothetical protein